MPSCMGKIAVLKVNDGRIKRFEKLDGIKAVHPIGNPSLE